MAITGAAESTLLRICTAGPICVVYPEGTWYRNVTPENADPRRAAAIASTTGLLPMLGLTPIIGRVFTEQEGVAGNHTVALISESAARKYVMRSRGGDSR